MEYIDLAIKYLSSFTDNVITFFNNGFVIAVFAAWLSVQLNNIVTGYRKYCEHISTRLIALHKAISTILNNQDWISSYEMKSINFEQLLNLTKHIEFNDCHFTDDIDKIFYSVALNYNRTLVTYINTVVQAKKSKKGYDHDAMCDISQITIESFESLIEISERNLEISRLTYINNLFNLQDTQLLHIQEKLKKFAMDSRHKSLRINKQE